MLALVVSLQVRPGHRDAFLAAITENAMRSFTHEPGCHSFDVTVDTADDHHFAFYELYTDEAAIDAHRAAPHFAAWRRRRARRARQPGQHHRRTAPAPRLDRSCGNECPDMTETMISSIAVISTVNPTTGGVLAEYPTFDDAQVESAIDTAHAAAAAWAATPFERRSEGPLPQHRAELRVRQAVPRRRPGGRGVHPAVR